LVLSPEGDGPTGPYRALIILLFFLQVFGGARGGPGFSAGKK